MKKRGKETETRSRAKTREDAKGATPWWVLIVGLVVFMAAVAVVMPFVPDDSYISFRYAENLADGNGLRYNAQDAPVEGYSNFLWVLVCAGIDAAGGSLPKAAPIVSVLLGLLCIGLLWRLFARSGLGGSSSILPILVLATAGPFVIYAVSGLETTLFALFLLGLVRGVDQVRANPSLTNHIILAVVGFLAALSRPEGVLAYVVVAVVLLLWSNIKRRPLFIGIASFAVLYVGYTIWRVSYFGDFWPTPFLSKAGGGGMALAAGWLKNLGQYFVVQGQEFSPTGYYVFGMLILAWLGWWRTFDRDRAAAGSVAFILAAVYFVVYFNFVDWMPGMRYHAPLIPLLLLPAAHVQGGLMGRDGGASKLGNGMKVALVAALVMLVSLSVFMPLRLDAHRIERGRQECLITVAEWLRAYPPVPNPKLAVSDVGAIPYYTGFYTIDFNPESLADRHIAHNGFSEEYFYSRDADILVFVSQGVYMPRFYPEHFQVGEKPRFDETYRLIGVARYDWIQDRSYWIYFPAETPPLSDEAYEAFPAGLGRLRRVQR